MTDATTVAAARALIGDSRYITRATADADGGRSAPIDDEVRFGSKPEEVIR